MVPSQLSVTAARGSGTLSCSTRPSGVLVGRTVPGNGAALQQPEAGLVDVEVVVLIRQVDQLPDLLDRLALGPSGTQTVVVVGSNTLIGLRVATISRPFSSTST